MNERNGFLPEFLAYLSARKWLVLVPVAAICLLLILAALLLFGPEAALKSLYQIF
jgi:hypothetical protein